MAVNLDGVFFVAKAVLKVMVKQGSGKVINVGMYFMDYFGALNLTNSFAASMWGLGASSALGPFSAYCAAKVAIPVIRILIAPHPLTSLVSREPW